MDKYGKVLIEWVGWFDGCNCHVQKNFTMHQMSESRMVRSRQNCRPIFKIVWGLQPHADDPDARLVEFQVDFFYQSNAFRQW